MLKIPRDAEVLTETQLSAISSIERAGSVLSILGCIFIITTFATSSAFHKPINRLVFYASFGNLMTNVATLIARDLLGSLDSAGCQFQGFLVQMFMPADALWTLAMAVNVYLTFYHKFDAAKLRRMEVWYMLLCYGIPFVPALVYVFVSTPERGRMYGDATLWCWVAIKWDVFRIATFYGPVWAVILVTFFIYIRAGRDIYNKRKQLRYFSSSHDPEPMPLDEFFSSKTTEVMVTSEVAATRQDAADADGSKEGGPSNEAAYSITISSNKREERASRADVSAQNNVQICEPSTARRSGRRRRVNMEAQSAAWSYARCAILFFTAILITWIPSSANRVYSVVHRNTSSHVLEFMSAVVLPLQGFWNAVIYTSTSWSACKYYFSELGHFTTPKEKPAYPEPHERKGSAFRFGVRKVRGQYETESMTELAGSRPNSNDEPKMSV